GVLSGLRRRLPRDARGDRYPRAKRFSCGGRRSARADDLAQRRAGLGRGTRATGTRELAALSAGDRPVAPTPRVGQTYRRAPWSCYGSWRRERIRPNAHEQRMSMGTRRPRLLDGQPPELLVYDEDTS